MHVYRSNFEDVLLKETRAWDRPDDDDKTNRYKSHNERCMREKKLKTEITEKNPEKKTKTGQLDSIGIETRNPNLSEFFWGQGTRSFHKVGNRGC